MKKEFIQLQLDFFAPEEPLCNREAELSAIGLKLSGEVYCFQTLQIPCSAVADASEGVFKAMVSFLKVKIEKMKTQ